jgi:hypothetical protein
MIDRRVTHIRMTAAFPQVPRHPRLAVAFLLSIGIFVGVTRDNVSHVIATTRTRVVEKYCVSSK